jgi:hypothetical protein
MIASRTCLAVTGLILAGLCVGFAADEAQAQWFTTCRTYCYSSPVVVAPPPVVVAPRPVVVAPPPVVCAPRPVYYAPRTVYCAPRYRSRSFGYVSYRSGASRCYSPRRSFSFGFGFSH